MKVIRDGKAKEVKRIRKGDIYVGKCWVCGSECLCEDLKNGHTNHFTDKEQARLFE